MMLSLLDARRYFVITAFGMKQEAKRTCEESLAATVIVRRFGTRWMSGVRDS